MSVCFWRGNKSINGQSMQTNEPNERADASEECLRWVNGLFRLNRHRRGNYSRLGRFLRKSSSPTKTKGIFREKTKKTKIQKTSHSSNQSLTCCPALTNTFVPTPTSLAGTSRSLPPSGDPSSFNSTIVASPGTVAHSDRRSPRA